jgi:iron complex outermembrane recepter protein
MHSLPRRPFRQALKLLFMVALSLCSRSESAPAAASGTINGRILNALTGEYVRNAEVRVQGTGYIVESVDGGFFTIPNVPAGTVTVAVSYTGYQPATTNLTVAAGQTTTTELKLTTYRESGSGDGKAVQMAGFVVSSEREGNAKAIMEQKRSMNIVNSVASDVFGEVTEGNVGEFLKNIPGIELEYSESEARGPRIRGMDPQYTAVTIDGQRYASADGQMSYGALENGVTGGGARSFGFEQISINSIESIEVSKTLSADMDADAPAGTINLKSKRAFDRQGRRISWQVNLTANSEEFTWAKTYGPGDSQRRKIVPGGVLEYSDIFFNKKLGVILNYSNSTLYSENYLTTHTVNTNMIPSDQRPAVLTQVAFKDSGKFTIRQAASLTTDLKLTPTLALSLTSIYNFYEGTIRNRNLTFVASAASTAAAGRPSVLGSDPLLSFTTSPAAGTNRSVSQGAGYVNKDTETYTFAPRLEYTSGSLSVEAKGVYSTSNNLYNTIGDRMAYAGVVGGVSNIDFTATRSDYDKADWKIKQLSGPDWSDLRNYLNPRVAGFFRKIVDERFSGQVDATYKTKLLFPLTLKAGAKVQQQIHDQQQLLNTYLAWNYIGPGGGPTGSWAAYPSAHPFDQGKTGAEFFSLNGARAPTWASPQAVGGLLQDHPEYFTFVPPSTANYYAGKVAGPTHYTETMPSGYAMATTRIERLQLQAGLRWEETKTASKEFDPRTRAEIRAAGFAVDNTGRATTNAGIDYQFLSKPRVWRKSSYDNYFPSVSAKFSFTDNLTLHAGFNKAISRPFFNSVSGVWNVNEDTLIVQAQNPGLLPELSNNYSTRLAYYFEPVGTVSVGFFQNDISNLREATQFTAEEFGYGDDPVYKDYTFVTQTNGSGTRRFRGMEVEYNQYLSFLPGVLKGFNVSASYVRNYASQRRPGLVPHRITAGLGYRFRGLNLRLSTVWTDDTSWTSIAARYRPSKTTYDLSGGYQFSRRLGIVFSGRNITNEPHTQFDRIAGSSQPVMVSYGQYGTAWTFGIKGTY